MRRWLVFLPLIGLIGAVALFGLYALRNDTTRIEPNAMVGKPAPVIVAPLLEGGAPLRVRTRRRRH